MGQRILIETTVIIKYLRALRKADTTFAKAIAKYDRCFLSVMTVYEIEFGSARAGRASDLSAILPFVEILEIDQPIAEQAARLHSILISLFWKLLNPQGQTKGPPIQTLL